MPFRLTLALAMLAVVSVAKAELIVRDWLAPGDGLLTRDTVTGREWLDLTETVLPEVDGGDPAARLAAFQGRLMEGGDLLGFRIATTADVTELAVSAGIDPDTSDITVNGAPAATLVTFTTSAEVAVELSENLYANGLAVNPSLQAIWFQYVPKPRSVPVASIVLNLPVTTASSIWIYRATVPEPSALSLIAALCLGMPRRLRGAERGSC